MNGNAEKRAGTAIPFLLKFKQPRPNRILDIRYDPQQHLNLIASENGAVPVMETRRGLEALKTLLRAPGGED